MFCLLRFRSFFICVSFFSVSALSFESILDLTLSETVVFKIRITYLVLNKHLGCCVWRLCETTKRVWNTAVFALKGCWKRNFFKGSFEFWVHLLLSVVFELHCSVFGGCCWPQSLKRFRIRDSEIFRYNNIGLKTGILISYFSFNYWRLRPT